MNRHPTPQTADELQGLARSEALVRLIETAPLVRRRYQFFVWMRNHLLPLVPHQVAVCGAYQRHQRALVLEVFNAIVVDPPALACLTDGDGALMQALLQRWAAQRCQPMAVCLSSLDDAQARAAAAPLLDARLDHWLVHAVSRPYRPLEVESLFLFASPEQPASAEQAASLDLVLAHLHLTYQRMLVNEREMGGQAPAAPARLAPAAARVTPREQQILMAIREGKNNQQIGEALGISALTVKNHVQKILRKLGASNRAQAAVMSVSLGAPAAAAAPSAAHSDSGIGR